MLPSNYVAMLLGYVSKSFGWNGNIIMLPSNYVAMLLG